MRGFLLSAGLVVTCVFAAVTSGVAETSSPTGDTLRAAEERGLRAVPADRLQSMLTAPAVSADGPVQLSRSWVDAQPKASGNAHWRCLSEALYFEARGETVKGQFAVAEVIMNRVKSARFPGNVCGVINQGTGRKYQCQFTYTCDGYKDVIGEPRAFDRVGKVARAIMDNGGNNLTNGATHYHTTAVSPRWSKTYTRTARIGVHLFYRHNFRTASN